MEKMAIADVTNVCDANIADIDSGSTNQAVEKHFVTSSHRYVHCVRCKFWPAGSAPRLTVTYAIVTREIESCNQFPAVSMTR